MAWGEDMFRVIMCSLLFVLFLSIQPVIAHDAWIEKQDGRLAVLYGHCGKHEPYDSTNVKEARGFDENGKPLAVEIRHDKDGALLAPQGTPSLVTMFYDGGYYVRTPDGGKKMTRRNAEGKFPVLEALRSQKCAKAFLAPGQAWSAIVGLPFEIVPEKDPFSLKPGDVLPMRILLDAKPIEGVTFKIGTAGHPDPKSLPKSDKDGKVSLVIPDAGLQVIAAAIKVPRKDDPDADVLSLCSSLSFEVRQ
jgi:nickel transport protein